MAIIAYVDGGVMSGGSPSAPALGGGAGVVLIEGGTDRILLEAAIPLVTGDTTNQRMELLAATHGIRRAKGVVGFSSDIVVRSDSAYVINCIRDSWWLKWMVGGKWSNSSGAPVANQDLWRELLSEVSMTHKTLAVKLGPSPWRKLSPEDGAVATAALRTGANVTFEKVKGHAGERFNELADELAGMAKRGRSVERTATR